MTFFYWYLVKRLFEFSFSNGKLGLFRYFLEIKVARSPKSLSLSQRKYLTDLLKETGTLVSKLIDTPIDPNIHFDQNLEESFADS